MKKRFNEQQIIAILKEAEAGLPVKNYAASTIFPMPVA